MGNGFPKLPLIHSMALAPLSFSIHPRSKGMILVVLNDCLHCFPFQLVGLIKRRR